MTALLIVLCVLIGMAGGVVLARTVPRPATPRTHRRLLDDAASLLHTIRTPTNLDRVDVLCDPSKEAADRWLSRYNKEFNR